MTADLSEVSARRAAMEAVAVDVVEPLRRYLYRRTDAATADDVLGETLLVLWRRLEDVPLDAAVPWAIGVARLQLANAARSARRQNRVAVKEAVHAEVRTVVSDPADANADRMLVDQALAELSPTDAELLRLWAWEDLDAKAISAVLGITPNAVAIRLHRARRRLRERCTSVEPAPRSSRREPSPTAPLTHGLTGRMRPMSHDDFTGTTDPELHDLLSRSDTAADLTPLSPSDLAALLARVTATDHTATGDISAVPTLTARDHFIVPGAEAEGTRVVPFRRRRARRVAVGLLGVAAAGLVAVTVLPALTGGTPSIVQLAAGGPAPSAPAQICADVTADALNVRTAAFAGRVLSVENGQAQLEVADVFAGDLTTPGDRVDVPQGDPMSASVDGGPLFFEVGTTYLISTSPSVVPNGPEQAVATCGLSGVETRTLRQLYDRAFD